MVFLNEHKITIGDKEESPFLNKIGVYQDGTTPMYRDTDGKLWAMSGHSHMGHIGMFCGNSLDDMKEVYPIHTNFCVGHADYAFSGIRYPEGIKPRGSIWPFGLYICPNTHRFFCFFHNETGWNSQGTGYDAYSYCDIPKCDFDFRHIGLMHSDDEGKNWIFDRWVLTSNEIGMCEKFNPNGDCLKGQKSGIISIGSGDFSTYIEPDGEYIYIYYNIIRGNTEKEEWESCDVYVARTRKRTDGVMGDFVKYYNGSFCEAGNLGKETPIATNAWHPRVLYLKKYGIYMMTASITKSDSPHVIDETHLRFSKDMVNWSEPIPLYKDGKPFGNHYIAAVDHSENGQPNVLEGDEFSFLTNHNGTDVLRFKAVIE